MQILRGSHVTVTTPTKTGDGYVMEPSVIDEVSGVETVVVQMDNGKGTWNVRPEWLSPYKPEVRTPINETTLLEWAKDRVRTNQSPMIEAAYEELLVAHDVMNLNSYSSGELREVVLNLHRNGTKGYTQMSISELMKEAEKRFYGPDSSLGEMVADLEELLETLGVESGEDDA